MNFMTKAVCKYVQKKGKKNGTKSLLVHIILFEICSPIIDISQFLYHQKLNFSLQGVLLVLGKQTFKPTNTEISVYIPTVEL